MYTTLVLSSLYSCHVLVFSSDVLFTRFIHVDYDVQYKLFPSPYVVFADDCSFICLHY